jgi:hypothetical protein
MIFLGAFYTASLGLYMKRILILIIALSLASCASTQEAANRLSSNFDGKNIDAFVLRHGAPFQRHQMNSGDLLYTWSSEIRAYGLPATTTVQGTRSPYGFSGTATTTGGGTVNVFCEVQILTTQDGTIKSISPFRDTIGMWTTSRCAEIFKE